MRSGEPDRKDPPTGHRGPPDWVFLVLLLPVTAVLVLALIAA